jgi:hypothetical protein
VVDGTELDLENNAMLGLGASTMYIRRDLVTVLKGMDPIVEGLPLPKNWKELKIKKTFSGVVNGFPYRATVFQVKKAGTISTVCQSAIHEIHWTASHVEIQMVDTACKDGKNLWTHEARESFHLIKIDQHLTASILKKANYLTAHRYLGFAISLDRIIGIGKSSTQEGLAVHLERMGIQNVDRNELK